MYTHAQLSTHLRSSFPLCKSDLKELVLASSQQMWGTHCLQQIWISVRNDTSPQATVSAWGVPCPAPGVLVWQRSSAAPHINSGVLGTTWAWLDINIATLPYLQRARALSCVDIPSSPDFLEGMHATWSAPNSTSVFSWRHRIVGTPYFAIFEFLLLFFFLFALCNPPVVFWQNL